MRLFSKLCILVVVVFLAASVMPAYSQQIKGDSEVGIAGSLSFTHSSPITTQATVIGQYGYFFTNKDLVGFTDVTLIQHSSGSTSGAEFIEGQYQHLFPVKSNPKLFPYVGGAAGEGIMWEEGTSTSMFSGMGQFGVKYYVSPKTSFDVSYNFNYMRQPGGTFQEDTSSDIVFGFTYIIGGPRPKH